MTSLIYWTPAAAEMDRVLTRLHHLWLAASIVAMSMILFAGLALAWPIFGPRLEALVAPVIVQTDKTTVTRDGDALVVDLWADRRRPECIWQDSLAAYAVSTPDGRWLPVSATRPGFVRRGGSRGPGENSFGLFRVEPVPLGSQVRVTWRYQCHDDWMTPAELGPWFVPGERK